MFSVYDNVTLILENIVIQGQPGNISALLRVESGGKLVINDGTVITGNENRNERSSPWGRERDAEYSSEGGGVYVGQNAGMIMNGGSICYNKRIHNSLGHGGGVVIDKDGYFNMLGGSIYQNEANDGGGGGVAVFFGEFLMNGGEIAGNKAYYGGGVYVRSYNLFYSSLTSTFIKEPLQGEISSGIIWGYPANDGKENYANGPTVWYAWKEGYYCVYRESTLGEYHSISTLYVWLNYNSNTIHPLSEWEYRAN